MDSYNVIITDRALEQLESYIDYIQYTLLNVQAADAVSLDAVDTCTKLQMLAGSFRLCNDSLLRSLGYHSVKFSKHKYVMLYRIVGKTAVVEAIYHQMQDYEATFADSLEEN